MALRVPTTLSVCLNCKINSDANAEKEFHEIFDEVGLELQLPFLVKTFFHFDLNEEDKQHLCDDCVNRLIELYDLDELVKEKSCKTNILKNELECSNNEESSQYPQNESFDQNNTQEYTNFKTFVSTQGADDIEIHKHNKSEGKDCSEYANIEDGVFFFNENKAAPFARHQNQSSNDIVENFREEGVDQTGKKEVSQDFNISLSSSVIKDEKSYLPEFNEHMEFVSDDENQNVEVNKQSNAKIIVGSLQLETKEQEDSQHFNISSSAIKDEKLYELESNEHMEFISDDENQNVEINKQYNSNSIGNVCKEVDKAEEAYAANKTYNENESQRDLHDEEVDDRSNQDLDSDDSNSLLEELNTTESNNIEHIDSDDFSEEDISSDTCSSEEENLLEETILSEGYDQVDLNEYLDKVLKTKFQNLLLTCEMECKMCLEKYDSFRKLLNHACMAEFEKKQQFSCIIKDCEEDAKSLRTLARHLVLNHYDKLERTVINSKCTACKQTFSNVLDFNMHTCWRKRILKKSVPNYKCKYCDLDFQSVKRYLFHMQFHLKKHRPKICLLCGDVFNNSYDFFEHTQYKHNPETASTCVRCKRPFRDIQAFNNHMELHEYCKYHFECALCPKRFSTKLDLKQHMKGFHVTSGTLAKKQKCKNITTTTQTTNNYNTTDTNVVPSFICSTCGLIRCDEEMIKDHIGSDNESPCFSSPVDKKVLSFCYSCENCSLDFLTIKHLKDHRLCDSHSNDLFHCVICKKSFNSLSYMRNHCNAHKDLKERRESFPLTRRFVCNIGDCQKFYTIWASLYNHSHPIHRTGRKKNPPTDLKCQICQKLYSSKPALVAHVRRIHKNKNATAN